MNKNISILSTKSKFQCFFIASVQYIFNEIEHGNDDKDLRLQVRKEISTENTNILKMSR